MTTNSKSALLDELTRSKIRVNYANAEKNELKNAQTRKELISLNEVKTKWAQDVSNVKAKFLAIPDKLAPQLSGSVLERNIVHAILKDAVYETLQELSDTFKHEN